MQDEIETIICPGQQDLHATKVDGERQCQKPRMQEEIETVICILQL